MEGHVTKKVGFLTLEIKTLHLMIILLFTDARDFYAIYNNVSIIYFFFAELGVV